MPGLVDVASLLSISKYYVVCDTLPRSIFSTTSIVAYIIRALPNTSRTLLLWRDELYILHHPTLQHSPLVLHLAYYTPYLLWRLDKCISQQSTHVCTSSYYSLGFPVSFIIFFFIIVSSWRLLSCFWTACISTSSLSRWGIATLEIAWAAATSWRSWTMLRCK